MGVRENIIKLRTLSTLTQEEFGEIAGVSRSAVSQWEGGFSEPRMGAIEKLAKHFNIPKSWLIEDFGMNGVVRDASGHIVQQNFDEPITAYVDDAAISDQMGSLMRNFIRLDDESRILVLGFVQGLLSKNASKERD